MATLYQSESTCTSCLRWLYRRSNALRTPLIMHSRGKKTSSRDKNVIVRLNQDLPGYGRKGSIVPMIRGQMRNVYFPQRLADYVTLVEKIEIKQKEIVVERDVTFGLDQAQEGAEIKEFVPTLIDQPAKRAGRQSTPVRVALDFLKPPAAYKALNKILPNEIVFYRTPIALKIQSASESANGPIGHPIYGSVNTGDISTAIKALVAETKIAGRIVIGDDDIIFVNSNLPEALSRDDRHRVKQLGDYGIGVSVKGHDAAISRRVRVLPEREAGIDVGKESHAVDELAGLAPIKGHVNSDVLKIEARTGELQEGILDLQDELDSILENARITKEPVSFTAAEEAEIAFGGDIAPSTRGAEMLIEQQERKPY